MIYFNLRFQWRRCFIELLACENGLIKMLQLYDSTHPLPLTRKLQKFLSYGDYLRFVLSSIFFIFGFDLFTLFSLSRVLTQGYSNGIEKEKKERFFKKMHCWLTFAVWWRKKSSIAFFLETLAAVNDGEYFSPNLSLLQTWHESIWNQSCILMLHDMFELKHIKNEFLLGLWCCCDLFCEIKVLAWNKKWYYLLNMIEFNKYICIFFFI